MNGVLVPALFGLAGMCLYAMVQHALIAAQRRRERRAVNIWFALLCAAVAAYVVLKAFAYQAESADEVVFLRRWETTAAILIFAVLPWFVREYAGHQDIRIPLAICGLLIAVLGANHLLPYGIHFAHLPAYERLTLPWDEQVADLLVHDPTAWHHAGWLAMMLVFAYSLWAGWRQYRGGERRRGITIMIAMALFLVFVLANKLANLGAIRFTHTAEFGFLSLLFVMGQGLTRELRDAHLRLKSIVDNVPAVVYLKDRDGRYLFINGLFETRFHVNEAGVAGRRDCDLFPAAQAETLRRHDALVLESRKAHRFEETVEVDGEPRLYLTFKFPIFDPDGQPYAVCGVSTDITEARKAAQELAVLRRQVWHADRVMRVSAVSSSLAHELLQPLTAIHTNAEAGLQHLRDAGDAADLAECRAILEDILRDDQRAVAVIGGLRAMLQRDDAHRQPFALAQAVDEILESMKGELRAHGVVCDRQLDPDCIVRADRVQISQVVLNLVMNAVDAMEQKPAGERRLQIEVCSNGDGLANLAVRDSGVGWPDGQLERIFESFYTTKAKGLGIGLALSRSIIEAHGGRIWASSGLGGGATVQFALPALTGETQ